jgi:hypothetical protein
MCISKRFPKQKPLRRFTSQKSLRQKVSKAISLRERVARAAFDGGVSENGSSRARDHAQHFRPPPVARRSSVS